MTTTKEAVKAVTIADFWAQSEKEITEAAKSKRLKALQRDGEIAIAKLESEADAADANLEANIQAALAGGSTMDTLFALKRSAKIARAKHADALKDYEEFFGEKPKLQ